MSLRLILNSALHVGDGPSPRGQYGREHQNQKPVIGWGGKGHIPPNLVVKSQVVNIAEVIRGHSK
jgi:hypothetical protein